MPRETCERGHAIAQAVVNVLDMEYLYVGLFDSDTEDRFGGHLDSPSSLYSDREHPIHFHSKLILSYPLLKVSLTLQLPLLHVLVVFALHVFHHVVRSPAAISGVALARAAAADRCRENNRIHSQGATLQAE